MTRRDTAQACAAMSTKSRWYLVALWLFLVVLMASLNGREIIYGSAPDRIAALGPLAFAGAIFLGLGWLAPRLRARKMILRDVTWTLGDEGVDQSTDVAHAQLKWAAFLKYRETPRVFLLYIQRSQAQFIPKRALTPEQTIELRTLLDAHVPRK